MGDKFKSILEFRSRKLNVLNKHGLLFDILQQQADGSGGYTDEGEDLFYNLLYTMDQDLRKTRIDLEKRKGEIDNTEYIKMRDSLDENISSMTKTLNYLLEID